MERYAIETEQGLILVHDTRVRKCEKRVVDIYDAARKAFETGEIGLYSGGNVGWRYKFPAYSESALTVPILEVFGEGMVVVLYETYRCLGRSAPEMREVIWHDGKLVTLHVGELFNAKAGPEIKRHNSERIIRECMTLADHYRDNQLSFKVHVTVSFRDGTYTATSNMSKMLVAAGKADTKVQAEMKVRKLGFIVEKRGRR